MARLAVVPLLLALCAAGASAATPLKTARSGDVSLQVPAAWTVKARTGAIALVVTARSPAGGYVPNVTVVRGPVRGKVSMEQWRRQIISGLVTVRSGTPRSRIVRLPAGRAVEVSIRDTRRGNRPRLLLYAVDGGRKAYIVTFTAGASAWRRFEPLFRTMARSIRVRR